MKKSGFGCEINNLYYGLLGFADDCSFIAHSRIALQCMLTICETYFTSNGIDISVNDIIAKSKTKCIAFNVDFVPASIMLYGKPLPWVDSHIHLGHLVHKDESMSHDTFCKRGEFISKIHALRQELGSQDPNVFMKLVSIYFCNFYGSNLWDLYGEATRKLFVAWNETVKTQFKLHFATHIFILQDIISLNHLRVNLLRRFIKFYDSLKHSSKLEVRNLFNIQRFDLRSSFGRNCRYLCREFDAASVDLISKEDISMPIVTPEYEKWRVPYLHKLMQIRDSGETGNFTRGEIQDTIDLICKS